MLLDNRITHLIGTAESFRLWALLRELLVRRLHRWLLRAFGRAKITLFDFGKNAKPALRRNETAHHFLRYVLGACPKQVLELDRSKFLNDI